MRATACPCTRAIDRSSHAGHRSIIVLTSLACTHPGQSEHRTPPAPIRTPEWSAHLVGQRRIRFTPPRGTSDHERHLVILFRRLYFPKHIFPPYLSVFGHRAISIREDRNIARRRNQFLTRKTPYSSMLIFANCGNPLMPGNSILLRFDTALRYFKVHYSEGYDRRVRAYSVLFESGEFAQINHCYVTLFTML